MREVIKTSLGFNIPVKFYESAEEADRAAGKPGALLEEGNNNLYYRAGCAQEAREIIAEVVEKATGVKRETTPVFKTVKGKDGAADTKESVKDKDGNAVLEFVLDEDEYVKKALASANMTKEHLADAVTAAVRAADNGAGLRVDIAKKERKLSGPKTLPEKYATGGASLLASGKVATFAKDYRKVVGEDLAADAQTDATKLGWALKRFFDTKRQNDEANYGVGR